MRHYLLQTIVFLEQLQYYAETAGAMLLMHGETLTLVSCLILALYTVDYSLLSVWCWFFVLFSIVIF